MEQTVHEFFHGFRQELLAGAEANGSFQLSEFMETVAGELIETAFIEGFEICHYRASQGMRIDGYWFNDDEETLDLFIADFDCRNELGSLTKTEVDAIFRRGIKFFEASAFRALYQKLEVTSPAYGLARRIADQLGSIRQINIHLLSERELSGRVQNVENGTAADIPVTFNIWDMSRLQRQCSARGHKEPLELDFREMFGTAIPCLPAHTASRTYESYLMVMPADILAGLYDKFGARLLEQNVRCFLQARGKVNQGIRRTILFEPEMFFAYNNGITATAQEVHVETGESGLQITFIRDLQIVNGGQTTASLFHTRRKDKAILQDVFVQMKLSVIDSTENENIVPKISEYANTQNRVNAADFFSNHPFHSRIEQFSRRLWAPAQQGTLRETRWFYERARGQYIDAQAGLSVSEQKRFKAENPKPQMFTKTDLAKFENVWDDHPKWVNLGAQKNFTRYAERIGREWNKSSDDFGEYYFRRIIARAIIFRSVEKLVSRQPWYNGGYRANIVAYAIAALNQVCRGVEKSIYFSKIWSLQKLPSALEEGFVISARHVCEDIISPPSGISNISEWCKKEQCWTSITSKLGLLAAQLPRKFFDELISIDDPVRNVPEIEKAINIEEIQ